MVHANSDRLQMRTLEVFKVPYLVKKMCKGITSLTFHTTDPNFDHDHINDKNL